MALIKSGRWQIRYLWLLWSLVIGVGGAAQKADTVVSKNLVYRAVDLAESMLNLVTYEKGRHAVAIYPAAGYSPRTGFEAGIMPVWQIKPAESWSKSTYRPTLISGNMLLSSTGMYELDFKADIYAGKGHLINFEMQWLSLPDKFYGIFSQNHLSTPILYTQKQLFFKGYYLKQWGKWWHLGMNFNVLFTSIEDFINVNIVGWDGGRDLGLGPLLVYDSRNSITYPVNGQYLLYQSSFFNTEWPNKQSFEMHVLDGRIYRQLNGVVWANQLKVEITNGQVPFYQLPALGGKRALRGISHPMKYIDRNLWFVQSELRRDLWWRLGGVVFVGTGNVFPNERSMFDQIKATAGLGLRFKVFPADNLNFRIDYGMSTNSENAVYFTLKEAF